MIIFHPGWEAGGGFSFVVFLFLFFLGFVFLMFTVHGVWEGRLRRGWGLKGTDVVTLGFGGF